MGAKLKDWCPSTDISLILTIGGLLLCNLSGCTPASQDTTPAQRVPALGPTSAMPPTATEHGFTTEAPLATALPAMTPTPQELLEGPVVAFTAVDANGNGYVLVVDMSRSLTRRLSWGDDIPIAVDWQSDGCGLNITLATASGIELVTGDLEANNLRTVFVGGHRMDGSFATWPVLAPDRKWVAYTSLSGEQGFAGSEFQNIEVIAAGNPSQPSILTANGGAWLAAWSHEGQRLAYSDDDPAGVAQLYHSNPDGSDRVQMTNFTGRGVTIGAIQWSPSDDMLAVAVYDHEEVGSLWLVSANGITRLKAKVEGGNRITDQFWWSEDGGSLAFYTQRSHELGARDDAIYWIDAATGNVDHVLEAAKAPDRHITQPFPVGDIRIVGFIGNESFFFYNAAHESFEQKEYPIELADLTGPARVAPVRFEGEAACQSK